MKKFLVMAILALSMVFTSCGISGGGIDNAPQCDDQAGTINGKAYDNVTYKCWKVDIWQKSDGSDPDDKKDYSETTYEWSTEYEVRKTWELWKATVNVNASAYGVWFRSSGDFTMTEVQGRDEDTCYESYGQ